jgi:hypothetical protein
MHSQPIIWTPFPDRHASTRVHHRLWLNSHKTGYKVSPPPHSPQMSAHDRQTTPPQDPEQVQAHLESQQSTKPNKGSSASGQLLVRVQYVYEELSTFHTVVNFACLERSPSNLGSRSTCADENTATRRP